MAAKYKSGTYTTHNGQTVQVAIVARSCHGNTTAYTVTFPDGTQFSVTTAKLTKLLNGHAK